MSRYGLKNCPCEVTVHDWDQCQEWCMRGGVQVPFMFKYAVDALSLDQSGATAANVAGLVCLTPPALLVGYGAARIGSSLCNELRNSVFAKVRRRRCFHFNHSASCLHRVDLCGIDCVD